jgi:hypothetical protein
MSPAAKRDPDTPETILSSQPEPASSTKRPAEQFVDTSDESAEKVEPVAGKNGVLKRMTIAQRKAKAPAVEAEEEEEEEEEGAPPPELERL